MLRIFRHYISASLLMLMLAEILICWGAIYLGVGLRFFGDELPVDIAPVWQKALLFTSVMFISLTALGLYKNLYREGIEGVILRLGISMILALAGMSILFYLFPYLFIGRGAFGWTFAAALLGIIIARAVFFKFVDNDSLKRKILVFGAGERAARFQTLRRKVDCLGFSIHGYIQVPGEKKLFSKDEVVCLDGSLIDYVQRHDIDEIVVAVEDRRRSFPINELLDCKMSGIDVVDELTFFERETGKVYIDTLQPSWLIFSDGFKQAGGQLAVKRAFDVLASSLILLLTWPLMLGAAIAIFIESGFRGPILYRQVRVGQNWSLFQVLKFRSMVVDAEKAGAPQWAKKNDARITRVGKLIRRTRIDELPQIFNVLRGDMSFIGPRPERPEFVEQLSESIPYYAERHRVKPGITGWAQIRYPYGASEDDAREKLQYDLYYVKNYSLFLDSLILFQTAEVVIFGNGAR